jgi:L-lactate dehydrogenase
MTTVAIIGAGEIGGAIAAALARDATAGRVLLVDTAREVAAGKALDILQSGSITASHTRLEATDELAAAAACDVCVLADAVAVPDAQEPPGRPLLARLLAEVRTGPLVFGGADQPAMLESAAIDGGADAARLIGAGPVAVAAAAAALVAIEAGCSPREVSLTVLGGPERGLVVPWSQAAISGLAVERLLHPPQIRRLDEAVAALWPPGPYALGAAAARVVRGLVTGSRASECVLAMLDGPFGVRRRVGAVPALLGPGGIARTIEPALTPRELMQVHTSLRW